MALNMHAIVSPIIAAVNPNVPCIIRFNEGTTTGPGLTKIPVYRDVPATAQVQALSAGDLRHVEAMNIQSVQRSMYLYGDIQGIDRPEKRGGDLIVVDGKTWLVRTVFETWPGWCKVGVTLQMDGVTP